MKMGILAESAVRITLLAIGVGVVLRALRIRSPRLAHGAWTAVVVVMLLLPVFITWGPQFAVPLLPSPFTSQSLTPYDGEVALGESGTTPPSTFGTNGTQSRMTWGTAALLVYVAGAGVLLLRLAIGFRRARAIRRSAVQIQGRLTHPACATPMTVGIVSPAVLLPPDWGSWGEAELSAILAHEEEHVRRRDPMVVAIALLNRAIFWFHPLAWWLQREIVRLSEQACDAVVIYGGHDSTVYSACLLRFARRAADAGGRIAPVATAMPGAGLQHRLAMLADPPPARPSGSRLACAALACAAIVLVCAAAVPTATQVQNASPGVRQAAWLVETSEHFEIFHDGLPGDRVSDAVRDAEAAYAQLSAALKHDLSWPVPIILVRRDRELQDTALRRNDVVGQRGDPRRQRLFISLESLDRQTGIIVHELTHQFAFDIVPLTSRVAPVLIEGLAEYERGAWRQEDLRMTRDGAAIGAIPSVASLDSPDRHWAHAMFDFVAAQHGAEGVRRLLFALRAQQTLVQAVPVAFAVTLDQFDEQYRSYVTARFGLL